MTTKRVLKSWVKKAIVIIIALGLIGLIILLNELDKKAYKKCISEENVVYCHNLIYGKY